MDSNAIVDKRNKLSRSYELIAEHGLISQGYEPAKGKVSRVDFIKKVFEYQFLPHYFGATPAWRKLIRRFSGKRTLPDFCIVGPMKSGTSDLAINILLHPNVMTPLAKEFGGADPDQWRVYYPTARQKARHAARHGSAMSPYLSPYMHWTDMSRNLSRMQPNTKVVLTLRDPVKRLYSHWKWEVLWAGKALASEMPILTSFADYADEAIASYMVGPLFTACDAEGLQTSIYWEAVGEWIEFFGRDNVLVLDVAEYFSDNNLFMRQVHDFVGLPRFDCPPFDTRINENPLVLAPPDAATIAKLKDFFRPHNEKLWALLGKKFDWDAAD